MRKTNGKRDCVTILTQYFRPEVAATAQMSSDLADGLSKEGWDVIVLTGQPSYLGSEEKLPGRELSNGIEIRRFFNPGWRKSRVTGRFMNAFIVSVLMILYLLFDRQHRLLLVDTTSPFFPLVARIISIIKRWRYIYWIQDVYPDIAVGLGYLRRGGIVEKVWNRLNVWCAVSASSVVTIGPKMKEIVQAKLPHEAAKNRLTVIHNWADGDSITPLPKEVFDPAQAMGEYDMSLWTTNAAGGAFNAYTMYMQTKNYKLGDKKADGNYGRWKCSKEADEAIANLPKVPQDDIKEITRRRQILQQAVYDDAPYIPVQNSGTGGMYTTKKWSGLKKAEDVDYFPRASGYNNMIHTVNDFD